jgi:MFS family permease
MRAEANIYKLYIIKMAKWFMLTMPILFLYYKEHGFTDAEAFQLKAVYSLAIVLFEIPSGYFADVLGRKLTLVIGAILGTLGFLLYSVTTGFTCFMLAEITLGIGQSFISGADSALLYDSLKLSGREHDFIKYEGRGYTIGNFSEAIAGALGGIIATVSLQLPFVLQTLIAFAAVPAALTLFEPPLDRKRKKPGIVDILKVVKYATVTNRQLRYNLLISSILGTATLTMAWTLPLYLTDVGFQTYSIGIVHALLNVVVGTSTLFAYRIEARLQPTRTIWFTSLSITAVFLLLGFIQSAWAVAALALFYFSRGIATPVFKYYVNRITSSEIRATVLSVRSLIIRLIFAILAPLYGWLSDLYGRPTAMRALGVTFTLLVGLAITLFLRALPPPDQSEPAT